MAYGTPTPANRLKGGEFVVIFMSGGRKWVIGKVAAPMPAPNGRVLISGEFGSSVMRPTARVRVVG